MSIYLVYLVLSVDRHKNTIQLLLYTKKYTKMRKEYKIRKQCNDFAEKSYMIEGPISRLGFNHVKGNRGKRAKVEIGPIKLSSYILVKGPIFTLALFP